MSTATRRTFTDDISARTGLAPAKVHRLVGEILDELTNAIARGDRIRFREFGIFRTRPASSKGIWNQRLGRFVARKQTRVVVFKPSGKLKRGIQR